MEKETDEIIIPEGATFKRKYDYLPYSFHRIVKILREDGNMELELISGYKFYRYENCYGNRQRRYNVRDCETGIIVYENVFLNDIRRLLANLDYPLHEPEEETRNQASAYFLKCVERIYEERQE